MNLTPREKDKLLIFSAALLAEKRLGRGVAYLTAGLLEGARDGKACGFRLNITSGTAVRFEPGQQRTVELVELAGDRIVYGFNARIMGKL